MVKEYSLLFIILLVITPSLMMVSPPISTATTTQSLSGPVETDVTVDIPDEDVELTMMFFTETVSSDDGLYYVCRRGTDTVAYFGASMVKYLSGDTVFTLEFPGSNSVLPAGVTPTGSTTNYLYGDNPAEWKTGVIDYSMLRYSDIYPGIDLVYKIQDGNLKYEFVVSPYANPKVIRLNFADADEMDVNSDWLRIFKDHQHMDDTNLMVYQSQGTEAVVDCVFRERDDNTIGFSIDEYDQSSTLIIDPVNLLYSTYLGGSSSDNLESMVVEDGAIYMTGYTSSTDFPAMNAYNSTYPGGTDTCFITKLSSDGQSLIYSTYLGGELSDQARGIAVEDGFVYVTGWTHSSNFPMVNAFNSTHGGGYECFVSKFSVDGQSLLYSTFLGGVDNDLANSIYVLDSYCYVVGYTKSNDFPTANAYDDTYNGDWDCFLTKFSEDGQSLIYSTLLGGSLSDVGYDVVVEDDYPYVVGSTSSSGFPVYSGYDSSYNGVLDGFVTKFASDGQSLVYSTFLGGSDYDVIKAVDIESGYVVVTGTTYSWNFPTVNAYDYGLHGTNDCFVTKLSTDGSLLEFSTYIGGSSYETGESITLENGYVYVTGNTESSDFDVKDAYDSSYNLAVDVFVTVLTPDGMNVYYSTFFGGHNDDECQAISVENEKVYIAGRTRSENLPMVDAYNSSWQGGTYDSFVGIFTPLDSDLDGLSNQEEMLLGTNLYNVDSDNDNYLDGYEVQCGTNPLDPNDYPHSDEPIEPVSLVYSTYLGGSQSDEGSAIGVEDGYTYVTGFTESTAFPMFNAFDSSYGGNYDCFVIKLAKDGQSLVYSTFLGGVDMDSGYGIAVEDGYVYVTGYTASTDYPVINAYNSTHSGGIDCFLTKIAIDGQSLVYSTFLGGSNDDDSNGIAIEDGYVYLTGNTKSPDFPLVNEIDSTYSGDYEVFVTKFASDGQSLVYSTFLGGVFTDQSDAIAVEDGTAYVTGVTNSIDFPIVNAYNSTYGGGFDCFVTKIASDGQLDYSTYLGGSDVDHGSSIAVEYGYVYVTGKTQSDNFPLVNAYNSTYGGGLDCFVAKMAIDGRSLIFSTYLGGSQDDVALSIDIDAGSVYLTGYTRSTNFPIVNAYTATHNMDMYDCFVTKMTNGGRSLVYSTYIGGSKDTVGNALFVHNEYVYVTGVTWSSDFPMDNAYDSTYGGNSDCFISILGVEEDSDSDGISNWDEVIIYGTNPDCIDSDNDNFLDSYEIKYGSDPTNAEDYPAIPQYWYDAIYQDLDGNATLLHQVTVWLEGNWTEISDILIDIDEFRTVLDGLGISVGDTDYDGLDDLDEVSYGTDPLCVDTDNDNLLDNFEIEIGTNPLESDSDLDSYLDGVEVMYGTDPLNPNDYPGATTTTTTTTTTSGTSTTPDDGTMLMIVMGVGGLVVVIIIIVVIKKKGS